MSTGFAAVLRINCAAELQHALAGRQVDVVYDAVTGKQGQIRIVEARGRWKHPVLGEIDDDRLRTIAGQDPMLEMALEDYVLDHALTYIGSWPQTGLDVPFAVRMSPCGDATTLDHRVMAAVCAADAAPSSIVVELPWSSHPDQDREMRRSIGRLRAQGVGVMMETAEGASLAAGAWEMGRLRPASIAGIDGGRPGPPAGVMPRRVESQDGRPDNEEARAK